MTRVFKFLAVALIAIVASEATADAQLLKNLLKKETSTTATTEETSTGTANGQAAGTALKGLYKQYKADGKLDMKNLNNIANAATFAANVKGLKGMSDKKTFYKEFVSGLILGSDNLVNENNSTTVMSGITSLVNNVDLSSLTSGLTNAASTAATTTSTATESSSDVQSALSGILSLFK